MFSKVFAPYTAHAASLAQRAQLTLFDMGGIMPPIMFLTTVLRRLGRGCCNLMTFNINLWSIRKVAFFPRLYGVTIATSLSEST